MATEDKKMKFINIDNSNFNLKKAQELVDEWINENGGYWNPFAMLTSVVEELGEFSKELSNIEKVKIKKDNNSNLEIELGDLIFSLICLANYYKIDILEALKKSIIKYTKRDWNRFICK